MTAVHSKIAEAFETFRRGAVEPHHRTDSKFCHKAVLSIVDVMGIIYTGKIKIKCRIGALPYTFGARLQAGQQSEGFGVQFFRRSDSVIGQKKAAATVFATAFGGTGSVI